MVEYLVVLQPRRSTFGLGSIRFRSPLLTESISLSFPPLTEMFHFSGFRVSYPMYSGMNDRVLPRSGYPIRIPPDHRLLAASRGFSQLAASFFACWHHGIHRTPLLSLNNRFFLVGLTGLEPVTPRLSSACSNQLSYRPGFGSLRDSYQILKFSY